MSLGALKEKDVVRSAEDEAAACCADAAPLSGGYL